MRSLKVMRAGTGTQEISFIWPKFDIDISDIGHFTEQSVKCRKADL